MASTLRSVSVTAFNSANAGTPRPMPILSPASILEFSTAMRDDHAQGYPGAHGIKGVSLK
jgi:hypothetical protein